MGGKRKGGGRREYRSEEEYSIRYNSNIIYV